MPYITFDNFLSLLEENGYRMNNDTKFDDYWYEQYIMYNHGVRDGNMHDATLSILSQVA